MPFAPAGRRLAARRPRRAAADGADWAGVADFAALAAARATGPLSRPVSPSAVRLRDGAVPESSPAAGPCSSPGAAGAAVRPAGSLSPAWAGTLVSPGAASAPGAGPAPGAGA